jgi:hypothetical protein
MRTYQDLTEEEQTRAREKALNDNLTAITEGIYPLGMEKRIEAAGKKANAMQTPWFWTEYIMDTCKDDLETMSLRDAEEALYPEPGERIIWI